MSAVVISTAQCSVVIFFGRSCRVPRRLQIMKSLHLKKKRAFFVSFIDLRLKRAVKIEASAKKKAIKQTKNAFFHARSGNGP